MPTTLVLRAADAADAPHRILPVFAGDADPLAPLPEGLRENARRTAALRRFKADAGKTLLLPFGEEQWVVVGLGAREALTRPAFCEALAKAFSELKGAGAAAMSLLLPAELPWPAEQAARWAGEALQMAGYAFRAYRTQASEEAPQIVVSVVAAGQRVAVEAGLAAAGHVAEGIALTRDLINHPAAVAHPDYVAEMAQRLAEAHGARFVRIRGEDLAQQGYGAIHAVGRGAEHPPQLVVLEYGTAAPDRPTVALVGKGVTFDSGGLDLKTSSGMALMKKDMGGAATVLGAFRAIAGLALPVHLVAVLALAENAVDALSYHPGDILRTRQGLTVEITNTDAEGRLVLADALALARDYAPRYLVDFATLTGACRVALGKQIMGLFCDDAPLREALQGAAQVTGDHVWPLPLWAPYRKELDSSVADLANAANGGMAGAITAALFLKEFAGEVAWAHIDCYAWSDGDAPLFPKGGSGVGVRLCTELITQLRETAGDGR
ncbi:MAG TPA: leucyl aminopeptidase family protein [bacterium]|nr:leucyl aminopeptidase family protein [bacterium]HKJ93263.1 leucyl aminopeptidase family protein [Longimicrobiales bacterium]